MLGYQMLDTRLTGGKRLGPHNKKSPCSWSKVRDTIKLKIDSTSDIHFIGSTLGFSPQSIVGYLQVLQRIQAREGFLGHRLDLVSKQSSAVSKHTGSQSPVGREREREREGKGERDT